MVIVCDCKYRSAITAIRAFSRLDEEIVAVSVDDNPNPPAFSSRYVKRRVVLSSDKEEYTKELLALCRNCKKPVLFPVGNFTLSVIAENKDLFSQYAHFCASDKSILENLNDKKWVKNFAKKAGLLTPVCYNEGENVIFPVVVKPFCGEKFGLRAEDRYRIVQNEEELKTALEYFKEYDPFPIIEEYINGDGVGVSLLVDKNSKVRCVFSHKRLIEFPANGGPSACLETFFDESLIESSVKFIEETDFEGLAMMEFKKSGDKYYLLEINPRVWGSFPAVEKAKSDILSCYYNASQNIDGQLSLHYKRGIKIKFLRGMTAALIENTIKKRFQKAFGIIIDILNPCIHHALFSINDPIPAIRDFFRR